MKYLSLAIVPFMVGVLIPLFFNLRRKSNLKKEAKMNKYDFVMCYSLFWALSAIITSIIVAAILILLNLFAEIRLEVNVIVIPFIVVFLFGAYAFVREKIVIKEDTIMITPIFGKARTYTFAEIKKVKKVVWSNGMTSYGIYKDKKIFSISDNVPGFNLFMERIKDAKIEIER